MSAVRMSRTREVAAVEALGALLKRLQTALAGESLALSGKRRRALRAERARRIALIARAMTHVGIARRHRRGLT
jgi:hypothetical protein